jgi:hypothetical protein
MILIRKNCFETNSSSSHSVSLAGEDKDFVLDTIYPDDSGVVEIDLQGFGWEWFKHNTAADKAAYAWIQFEHNEMTREVILDIIKEQTGANEVKFVKDPFDSLGSYIDHDSHGIVSSDRKDLRNFIFNKNSWLFGGNDNDTAEPGFYDVPVYKKDGDKVTVKKVKASHYLEFRDLKGVRHITFNSVPTEEQIGEALHWAIGGWDSYVRKNDDYFMDKETITRYLSYDEREKNGHEFRHSTYDPATMTGTAIFQDREVDYKDRDKPENQRVFNFSVKDISKYKNEDDTEAQVAATDAV